MSDPLLEVSEASWRTGVPMKAIRAWVASRQLQSTEGQVRVSQIRLVQQVAALKRVQVERRRHMR